MQNYNIPADDRRLLVPIHRRFQAAVSTLANVKAGATPPFRVDGIHKFEGGVVVNGREIAIKKSWVVDDFGSRGATPATAEETATVDAMIEAVQRVRRGDDLSEFAAAAERLNGNHLHSFFEGIE